MLNAEKWVHFERDLAEEGKVDGWWQQHGTRFSIV